jgi:hypothetical protein
MDSCKMASREKVYMSEVYDFKSKPKFIRDNQAVVIDRKLTHKDTNVYYHLIVLVRMILLSIITKNNQSVNVFICDSEKIEITLKIFLMK